MENENDLAKELDEMCVELIDKLSDSQLIEIKDLLHSSRIQAQMKVSKYLNCSAVMSCFVIDYIKESNE